MLLTSIGMCFLVRAWDPPFAFRLNDLAERAIVCNSQFSVLSLEKKRLDEERARWESPHVYINDPQPLIQLRESLWNAVAGILNAHSYDRLDAKGREDWLHFLKPVGKDFIPEDVNPQAVFAEFVAFFKDDTSLDHFTNRLKKAFTPFEVYGMLASLTFGPDRGSQDQILVYRKGETADRAISFKVSDVLIRDGARLREALQRELQNETMSTLLFNWLYPKLEETLKEDKNATATIAQKAVENVSDAYIEYVPGQVLVEAGMLIGKEELHLLSAEYQASLKKRSEARRVLRFSAVSGCVMILFVICWGFVRRRERRRPKTPRTFMAMMFGMLLTVAMAQLPQDYALVSADWEILPMLLFVMAVSITYSWELAIVFSTILILIISMGSGGSLGFVFLMLSVTVSAALQLGRLKTRRKLLNVSVVAGAVAFAVTMTIGITSGRELDGLLFLDASINLFWSILAGLVMTGLLPFIEGPFGILTDMSLLELGDVSHPLLQNLIRLAPATYGHSMQVGAIAESAADAIGARGLLTRVGAYFHDIGKIMKPEYYSENQGGIMNIHDQLEPQVSTIVVIAHVKDGADLAKQYRLPRPLIDLLEQHHGTSLVSFFYGRAKAAGERDQTVEESTYRYPGPKPQTKEAAILMIADSCESACRSMGAAATPGKIENKVRIVIKHKLDDGQFDESGLTLQELKTIENSVIKTIIAASHGRIRYPGQNDDETLETVAQKQ